MVNNKGEKKMATLQENRSLIEKNLLSSKVLQDVRIGLKIFKLLGLESLLRITVYNDDKVQKFSTITHLSQVEEYLVDEAIKANNTEYVDVTYNMLALTLKDGTKQYVEIHLSNAQMGVTLNVGERLAKTTKQFNKNNYLNIRFLALDNLSGEMASSKNGSVEKVLDYLAYNSGDVVGNIIKQTGNSRVTYTKNNSTHLVTPRETHMLSNVFKRKEGRTIVIQFTEDRVTGNLKDYSINAVDNGEMVEEIQFKSPEQVGNTSKANTVILVNGYQKQFFIRAVERLDLVFFQLGLTYKVLSHKINMRTNEVQENETDATRIEELLEYHLSTSDMSRYNSEKKRIEFKTGSEMYHLDIVFRFLGKDLGVQQVLACSNEVSHLVGYQQYVLNHPSYAPRKRISNALQALRKDFTRTTKEGVTYAVEHVTYRKAGYSVQKGVNATQAINQFFYDSNSILKTLDNSVLVADFTKPRTFSLQRHGNGGTYRLRCDSGIEKVEQGVRMFLHEGD